MAVGSETVRGIQLTFNYIRCVKKNQEKSGYGATTANIELIRILEEDFGQVFREAAPLEKRLSQFPFSIGELILLPHIQ